MIAQQLSLNGSNHSTVSAAETYPKAMNRTSTATARPKSSRKRVRFNMSANVSYDNTVLCAEDCKETWYSSGDYKEFKTENRDIIFSMQILGNDTFVNCLNEFLQAVVSLDFVVEDVSKIMDDALKQKLQALYTSGGDVEDDFDLIGIECHLNKSVRQEFQNRRASIQNVVAEIQEEYKQGLWSDVEVGEELRDSCTNFSQAPCLCAQFLAQAQLFA